MLFVAVPGLVLSEYSTCLSWLWQPLLTPLVSWSTAVLRVWRYMLQVGRAELRLKGIQSMLSLIHKDFLIPSVKHSILCGWQGLITVGTRPR